MTNSYYFGILCIAFAILSISIVVMLILFYKHTKHHQRELLELARYSTNVQAIIDSSIPQILDTIITDAFQDYQVMELLPRNEPYITDEREKEIRSKLIEKVANRLSPMALDKISLFYNIHKIDEIIADKVYIIVMNYVIEHNRLIQTK